MDNELFLNKDGETYQEIMLLLLELQKTLILYVFKINGTLSSKINCSISVINL